MEFTIEESFPVSAKMLYETWLDSDGHTDMTGGEALITDEEGDPFNAWDGYIWGKNLELKVGEYIKQSWKTSEFDEDQEYSIVEITFKESNGQTTLILKHSNLQDKDDHYKQGWLDHYFEPMKVYFGS
jgi:activator of HSP90 ATPase